MKHTLGAIILPAAAFITMTGTGFAAWTFNQSSTASQNTNSQVNAAVAEAYENEIGTVAVDGELTLDQAGIDDIDVIVPLDFSRMANPGEAVDFSFTVNAVISGGLRDYVEVTAVEASDTRSEEKTEVENNTVTEKNLTEDVNAIVTFSFDYVEGMKPTTFAEYQAMVLAVQDGKLSFQVSTLSINTK